MMIIRIRLPTPLDWSNLHNLIPIINTALTIFASEGISGGRSFRPFPPLAIPSREDDDAVSNDFVSLSWEASSIRLKIVFDHSTKRNHWLNVGTKTCLGLLLGGFDFVSFLLFFNPSLSLRPVEGWTNTPDGLLLPDDVVVFGSNDLFSFFLLNIPADGVGACPDGPGARIVSVTYLDRYVTD